MRSVLIAALLIATPASAQQTQCQWIGQVWSCNSLPRIQPMPTLQQPNPNVMWDAYRAGQEARQRDEQAKRERQQYQQQQADRSFDQAQREIARAKQDRLITLRASAAEMLKNGDCDGAIKLALDASEIGLAAEVKSFCAK